MKPGPVAMRTAVAVAVGLLAAWVANGQDTTLTAPKRGDSAVPSDRRKENPVPPQVDQGSGRRRIEDTVQIISIEDGKPDADGRRKVTVKLHYVLASYPRGTLTLGFNLRSPTKLVPVARQEALRGTDDVELSASIVPIAWPNNQPFKLYVSLSAEPHPKQTSLLAAVSQPMKPAPPVDER